MALPTNYELFIRRGTREIFVPIDSLKPSFGPRITTWVVDSETALDSPLRTTANHFLLIAESIF